MQSTLPTPLNGRSYETNHEWIDCGQASDRTGWHSQISNFFEYWLSICPSGRLPGRQHFDPLHIAKLMARVWMLDVVRGASGPRFRYRLVGTKEVEALQREVTGHWLDEAHPHVLESYRGFQRFISMATSGQPTYRKGEVTFTHHKDHRIVENCMVPLARDGASVDMIAVCSVLYRLDGREN
jgi:PAS domain